MNGKRELIIEQRVPILWQHGDAFCCELNLAQSCIRDVAIFLGAFEGTVRRCAKRLGLQISISTDLVWDNDAHAMSARLLARSDSAEVGQLDAFDSQWDLLRQAVVRAYNAACPMVEQCHAAALRGQPYDISSLNPSTDQEHQIELDQSATKLARYLASKSFTGSSQFEPIIDGTALRQLQTVQVPSTSFIKMEECAEEFVGRIIEFNDNECRMELQTMERRSERLSFTKKIRAKILESLTRFDQVKVSVHQPRGINQSSAKKPIREIDKFVVKTKGLFEHNSTDAK